MRAKKYLGQHFLHSPTALQQILKAGDLKQNETVLEIGPGRGALTQTLLTQAGKVLAIEKDRELIDYLHERFANELKEKKLSLIEGDVLESDPGTLLQRPYKLIANIPYYITGAIIRHFLSARAQPTLMVLLIQKEVAERIVAADGKESLLSLSVKVFGEPSVVGYVPAGAFSPPPSVDSAILKVSNISRERLQGVNESVFFELLHKGFGSKRKMLKGNLKISVETLISCGIPEKARAEDVTLKQWLSLTQKLSS